MSRQQNLERPFEEPLRPTSVAEASNQSFSSAGNSFVSAGLFGRRIRLGPLIQLLRRVGQSLHAGIDVRRIWETECNRCSSAHRPYFEEIKRRIASGDTLHEALLGLGSYFPSLVCELVDVGERTGRLEQVLLRLAEHYEHLQKLRRSFLLGITWPAIQLVAALGIVGLMLLIIGIVAPTVDILGIGFVGMRGLMIYATLVTSVAAIFFGFLFAVRQGVFGSAPIRLAMKIPVLGNVFQTNALATLTWTLSIALESGVDARQSIKMALRSTQMPHYLALIEGVDNAILNGSEFHEALRRTQTFPDEFLNALETAELSGQLSESMIQLSNDYTQRAQAANLVLTMFATFGTWGCVAAMLIFLIFRVFFFYLGQLNDALNQV